MTLRCCVIGSGSLPVQCGERILARGHELCAVLTTDEGLRDWARSRGVAVPAPPERAAEVLTEAAPDYLFSIVNAAIVPEAALRAVRRAAINYHDAPLPRYAGMYATSWALLRGETEHGISWHVMTDLVDAGDLLVQRKVPVGARDTAFTLNARCYSAAIEGFDELLDGLENGGPGRTVQDLSERTFFPRSHRPPAAGLLRWERPAEELDALVRALDFGPQPNPIALPGLFVGDATYFVTEAVPSGPPGGEAPGTVRSVASGAVEVATAGRGLLIRRLIDHIGEPVDLAARHGVAPGDRLPIPSAGDVAALERLGERAATHEPYWTRRLAAPRPAVLPDWIVPPRGSGTDATETLVTTLPPGQSPETVIAAFAAHLARTTRRATLDLAVAGVLPGDAAPVVRHLFAGTAPMRCEVASGASLAEVRERVAARLAQVAERGPYRRDIWARYHADPAARAALPVAVRVLGRDEPARPAAGAALTLAVAGDGQRCAWIHDPQALPAAALRRMADGFGAFLAAGAPHHGDGGVRERARITGPSRGLVELLDRQAAREPDAAAVEADGERIGYGELVGRVERRAAELGELRGRRLTVPWDAGLESIVSLYAVLAAGGVCALGAGRAEGGMGVELRTATRSTVVRDAEIGIAVAAAAARLGLRADDRLPYWSAPGSWLWLVELGAAVAAGACLVLPGPDLAGALVDATFVCGTPRRVIDWSRAVRTGGDPEEHTALRGICLAGGRVHRAVLEELAETFWDVPVSVGYGAAGPALLATVAEKSDGTDLGAPLPHVGVRLLDADGEPALDGAIGEIELAVGADRDRTGDLARWNGDGSLRWVGRRDEEVTRHGYRFPASEVVAALLRHPFVADAEVEPRGEDLAAVVVPVPGRSLSENDLRRLLGTLVSPVMIPTDIRIAE